MTGKIGQIEAALSDVAGVTTAPIVLASDLVTLPKPVKDRRGSGNEEGVLENKTFRKGDFRQGDNRDGVENVIVASSAELVKVP